MTKTVMIVLAVVSPILLTIGVVLLVGRNQEAPPMSGTCVDVAPSVYQGELPPDPVVRCAWRGRSWKCEAKSGLFTTRWSCFDAGSAATERAP